MSFRSSRGGSGPVFSGWTASTFLLFFWTLGSLTSVPIMGWGFSYSTDVSVTVLVSDPEKTVVEIQIPRNVEIDSQHRVAFHLALPPRDFDVLARVLSFHDLDSRGRAIGSPRSPATEGMALEMAYRLVSTHSAISYDRHIVQTVVHTRISRREGDSERLFGLAKMRLEYVMKGELFPDAEPLARTTPAAEQTFEPIFQSILSNYEVSRSFRFRPLPVEKPFFTAVQETLNRGGSVLRIRTEKEGVYRIGPKELEIAGFPGTATGYPRLWTAGAETPSIFWPGPKETPENGPYVFFYDDGEGTSFSSKRTYWLTIQEEGPLSDYRTIPQPSGEVAPVTTVVRSLRIGEFHLLREKDPYFSGEWFVSEILPNKPAEFIFTLDPPPCATAEILLLTASGHTESVTSTIRINEGNEIQVPLPEYPSSNLEPIRIPIPGEAFRAGPNRIHLQLDPGTPLPTRPFHPTVYLKRLEIRWPSLPVPADGSIRFHGLENESREIRIQPVGMSQESLAFRVKPDLSLILQERGETGTDFVLPASPEAVFELIELDAVKTPDEIVRVDSFVLRRDDLQADYLLISKDYTRPGLVEHSEFLRARGLVPLMVDIEDIYDEFGFGDADPEAIREFMRYVRAHWRPPLPSVALLLGKARWDIRNRTGSTVPNEVPVYIPDLRTLSRAGDSWFGRLQEFRHVDSSVDLPNLLIGRVPTGDPERVRTFLQKSRGYEESPLGIWKSRGLFVADQGFEEIAENLVRNSFPAWIRPILFRYPDYPVRDHVRIQMTLPATKGQCKTSPSATLDLLEHLGKGVFLWDYLGHGGAHVLSNADLFLGGERYDNDVDRMRNQDRLTLFTSLSCLTGHFISTDPRYVSLSESLLLNGDHGAFASLAPSGYGSTLGTDPLEISLRRALNHPEIETLGQMIGYAQIGTLLTGAMRNTIEHFVLFGDPVVRLARPRNSLSMDLQKQEPNGKTRLVSLDLMLPPDFTGFLNFEALDMNRVASLWNSGDLPHPYRESPITLTLPGIAPEMEVRLHAYAWDENAGWDGAGSVNLPPLVPDVRFLPDDCRLVSAGQTADATLVLRNRTSRTETNLQLISRTESTFLEPLPLPEIPPREALLVTHPIPIEPGMNRLVFRVQTGEDAEHPLDEWSAIAFGTTGEKRVAMAFGPESLRFTPKLEGLSLQARMPVTLSMVTANIGGEAFPGGRMAVLDPEGNPILESIVPELASGETHTSKADWIIPIESPFVLSASLEYPDSRALSSEDGMSGRTPVLLTFRKEFDFGRLADLVPAGTVQVDPPNPLEGDSVRFLVSVRNDGNGPSLPFLLEIQRKLEDGTWRPIRTKAESFSYIEWPRCQTGLLPGEVFETQVFWHSTGLSEEQLLRLVIDPENRVPESDKENNQLEFQFSFRPGLKTLLARRDAAWETLSLDEVRENNERIIALLDEERGEFPDDTWLDYDWFSHRAMASLLSGSLEDAEAALRKGISLHYPYPVYDFLLAQVHRRRGDYLEALSSAAKARGKSLAYWQELLYLKEAAFLAGKSCLKNGDTEKGLELLQHSAENYPANFEAWRALADCREVHSDFEGTLTALIEDGVSSMGILPYPPNQGWYRRTASHAMNTGADTPFLRRLLEVLEQRHPEDGCVPLTRSYFAYLEGNHVPLSEFLGEGTRGLSLYPSASIAMSMLNTRLRIDHGDAQAASSAYRDYASRLASTGADLFAPCWPEVVRAKTERLKNMRVYLVNSGRDLTEARPFRFLQRETPDEPLILSASDILRFEFGTDLEIDAIGIFLEPGKNPDAWSIETRWDVSPFRPQVTPWIETAPTKHHGNLFQFPPHFGKVIEIRLVADGEPEKTFMVRDVSLFETTASVVARHKIRMDRGDFPGVRVPPEVFDFLPE